MCHHYQLRPLYPSPIPESQWVAEQMKQHTITGSGSCTP